MPNSSTNERPRSTSPPSRKSASTASSVVPAVMIVRDRVSLMPSLITCASGSRFGLRMFSRTRSKMTTVSLTE